MISGKRRSASLEIVWSGTSAVRPSGGRAVATPNGADAYNGRDGPIDSALISIPVPKSAVDFCQVSSKDEKEPIGAGLAHQC